MSLIFTSLLLLIYARHTLADCKSFSLASTNATLGPEIPISLGYTCAQPGNASCALNMVPTNSSYVKIPFSIGGVTSQPAALNITASPNVARSLYGLVASTTHTEWYDPLQHNVSDEIGFGLANGDSGWAVYVPGLVCQVGTLGNCTGDGYPSDGTVVQACTANGGQSSCGGYRCGTGTVTWHHSTKEEADAVVCDACQRAGQKKDGTVVVSAAEKSHGVSGIAAVAALLIVAFHA